MAQKSERLPFLFLVLAGVLATTAFIFEKHFENYFPLDEGRVLTYGYTRSKDSSMQEKAKITVSNQAAKTLEGKTVSPRKYEKISEKGEKQNYTVFFHNDKEGILMAAIQGEKEDQPKSLPQKIYYLKNPLKVGTTWGGGDSPQGVVESLSEKVAVPAGTFEGCIKVKLTYPHNMPVKDAVLWFAERVGIIKSVYVYKDGMREEFQALSLSP
jgi:hypothetical protein